MSTKSRLRKGDHVVAAYAKLASGPGWSNTPVWVIVESCTGELRTECLQPEEQTPGMQLLYGISASVHQAMNAEAEAALSRKGSKR